MEIERASHSSLDKSGMLCGKFIPTRAYYILEQTTKAIWQSSEASGSKFQCKPSLISISPIDNRYMNHQFVKEKKRNSLVSRQTDQIAKSHSSDQCSMGLVGCTITYSKQPVAKTKQWQGH